MNVGMLRGFIEGARVPCSRLLPLTTPIPSIQQSRGYPTQKYFKIKAENTKRNRIKKLQKLDEVKLSFRDIQKAKLKKTVLGSRRYTEANWPKVVNTDDVHLLRQIVRPEFDLETCVKMHKEILHPSMYNKPNAILQAVVEFDMHAKKKGRFLDSITGSLLLPHFFEYKRQLTRILCFCQKPETATEALEKGANLAGGEQLVKKIEAGEVDVASFDTVLCESTMLEAISPLKNILKLQMPKMGRPDLVARDVITLVERHRKAIIYTARGDVYEPDYASLTLPIANLEMPVDQIRENIEQLIVELGKHAPKNRTVRSFITEISLTCPPSKESIVLDLSKFFPEPTGKKGQVPMAEDKEQFAEPTA